MDVANYTRLNKDVVGETLSIRTEFSSVAAQLIKVTPGKKEPHLKSGLNQIGLWPCLGGMLIIVHWYRRVQPTVGRAIPRQMGLCYKKGRESKPGAVLLHGFCFKLQPGVTALISLIDRLLLVSKINHFFPLGVFWWVHSPQHWWRQLAFTSFRSATSKGNHGHPTWYWWCSPFETSSEFFPEASLLHDI